jgi:hypothetical protein
MKRIAAFAALFGALMFCASSASSAAQDNTRNWEYGNVIATTEVHIEPGSLNAYINDLNGLWRIFLDQQIKDGNTVKYQIIQNSFPRDGEADLILITVHPNWAAFDLSNEYFEDLTKKLQGSLEKARNAHLDRVKLRRLGSNGVYQEINFKK